MSTKSKKSPKYEKLKQSLLDIIDRFKKYRILVIGDLMWDEYIWGNCDRISPEAPVPVIQSRKEERIPGGATNVLRNLITLGIIPSIMGVVGSDQNGFAMQKEIRKWGLELSHVWEVIDRPTIVKTRIFARNQQILRLDREDPKPVKKYIENRLLEVLSRDIDQFDSIILSDYGKGLFTPFLIEEIISLAQKSKKYLVVDPQVSNFKSYSGANLLTPNEKEASLAMKVDIPSNNREIEKLGSMILKSLDIQHLLITRAHKGMTLFDKSSNTPIYIPTIAKEVYDVTGAGDTVVSVFTAATMAGGSLLESALLSNLAAGLVVGKLGASTVSVEQLKQLVISNPIPKQQWVV